MDILENPKHLKKMAKSLDSLIKDNHFVTCLMGKKERIVISGKVGYYLTPINCPFYSREYPYTKEIQHVRKNGSPQLDELIEMMEKGNFEIK